MYFSGIREKKEEIKPRTIANEDRGYFSFWWYSLDENWQRVNHLSYVEWRDLRFVKEIHLIYVKTNFRKLSIREWKSKYRSVLRSSDKQWQSHSLITMGKARLQVGNTPRYFTHNSPYSNVRYITLPWHCYGFFLQCYLLHKTYYSAW